MSFVDMVRTVLVRGARTRAEIVEVLYKEFKFLYTKPEVSHKVSSTLARFKREGLVKNPDRGRYEWVESVI